MALPIMENMCVTFKNEKEKKEFFSDRLRNHAELQKEINEPFVIDYKVFAKTSAEKIEHANMKLAWVKQHKF